MASPDSQSCHFLAHQLISCLRTMILEAVNIYKNGKMLLKQPRLTMAIVGNVSIRQDCSYKNLKVKVLQTEWDTCFNWYTAVSKRLQDSKIASLKYLLHKANEKLKTQEVPNTKDNRAAVHTAPSILLDLSTHTLCLNCLSFWRDYQPATS